MEAWARLEEHVRAWFVDPDMEATRLAMSVVYSHQLSTDRPTWLFVIGEPSTGKTALLINILRFMQPGTKARIYNLGDFSSKALLSGFRTGQEYKTSLLLRAGSQIVFLIPDFTVFLQKRPQDRDELMGLLRQLWDGYVTRDVGSSDTQLEWRGKCTIVAACTPALESMWQVYNELGNRFVQVRWRAPDGYQLALSALSQIDMAERIWGPMEALVKSFVVGAPKAALPARDMLERIAQHAAMVAELRRTVERNGMGDIIRVSGAEGPARIALAMAQTARAHASLFRRRVPDENDWKIAARLARDSVPIMRAKILQAASGTMDISEIAMKTGLPISSCRTITQDLAAIGFLSSEESIGATWVSPTQKARDAAEIIGG